ncbi:bile acid:sodium symporter family protein [Brevundimonas vesicularis]|uniref:Bile acid:sodium symporter n=1 Tax=Brevundimonas vesicularis TaxID=41276 RepID=A0A1Z3U9J0_BREVE|nr:bile acid:sodium symporter family protein [Brevundimonas vesicularis]ASE39892.1 bile acid:sodium symporter [Brevundimonas vesicularis]MDX2335089.1 bile acid:sodium symporter [Brevundimonas vesicularis]
MPRFLSRLPIDGYLLALIGMVILAALFPASGQAAVVMDWVVKAAIALLFFLYGARMSPAAIGAGLMHWRLQGTVFLSTFLLFPLLGLGLVFLMRGSLQPDLLTGMLYLCLLPSTVQSSIAFTSIAGGNVAGALTSASLSNLLGVIVTPLLVALLIGGANGGIHLQSIFDIGLQILAPFAVGQLCRPLLKDWLTRHAKLTGLVDRGSILLIVYAAFSEGVVAGVWSQVAPLDLAKVIGLNIALLAIVLALTLFAGRALQFDRPDRIVILFCGSKKSMATGIPMAGILFAGHAVPLIVLPIMLFHQIQLFACTIIAQRYARENEAVAVIEQTA